MTAITVTAAQVGLVDPGRAKVKSYIALETITKGVAVYIDPTYGKVGLCDGNAAGKYQFRGIALNAASAGCAVDVCEDGELYGFTLSGNYDTLVYVSDDAGVLADAHGTVTIRCGRVAPLSNKDITKVLRVFTYWEGDWA